MCISSTTIAGGGQHSFNTCLRCTSYRGCRPTHHIPSLNSCPSFKFNVGPALQPIVGLIPVNHLRRWPNTNPSLGMSSTLARIETALGDCIVFSDCCIAMRVTLYIPAPETPDNTIHWPNGDVMLVHLLRSWANIIPTKTL